uniref:RdRp n=1 Tax=viral metagenome TaxID=1070528 RepID=A0A8J9RPE4_9ZZZZ
MSKYIDCKVRYERNLRRVTPPDPDLRLRVQQPRIEVDRPVKNAITRICGANVYNKTITEFRRSQMTEAAVIKDIMRLDYEPWDIIEDNILTEAIDQAFTGLFGNKVFQPIHFCELRGYPWKWSKSACAPYIDDEATRHKLTDAFKAGDLVNDRPTFKNLRNQIFDENRLKIHQIKEGTEHDYIYDYLAFARAHLVTGEDPDKIRFIYGTSKLTIFAECMFFWPFHNHLKNTLGKHNIAWGYETLSGGQYRLATDTPNTRFDSTICWDWSEFDKRFHFRLQELIFEKLLQFMDFKNGYHPTWEYPNSGPKTPEEAEQQHVRLTRLYKWMIRSIMDAAIRAPDGSRWIRLFTGLASGIFNTNFLDSIANLIVILTVLSALGIQITKPDHLFIRVMGDDSIFRLIYSVQALGIINFVERFKYEAFRRFHFITNESKTSITPTLEGSTFLGYFCRGLIPQRDPIKLLASLAYPERKTNWQRLAARCVGIAWASAYQDPMVYKTCEDVYNFITKTLKFKPDQRGAYWIEYLLGEIPEVDSFPTPQQIMAKLLPTHDQLETGSMSSTQFIFSRSHYKAKVSALQKLGCWTSHPVTLDCPCLNE